jgi:hypothetical protein
MLLCYWNVISLISFTWKRKRLRKPERGQSKYLQRSIHKSEETKISKHVTFMAVEWQQSVQKPTELKADRNEPLTIDLTEHQQLIVNRTEIKMNEVEPVIKEYKKSVYKPKKVNRNVPLMSGITKCHQSTKKLEERLLSETEITESENELKKFICRPKNTDVYMEELKLKSDGERHIIQVKDDRQYSAEISGLKKMGLTKANQETELKGSETSSFCHMQMDIVGVYPEDEVGIMTRMINIPENIKQFGDEAIPIVKVEDCNRSNALQDETSQFLGIKTLPLQLCGTTKEIAGENDLLTLYGSVAFDSKVQSSLRKRKGEDLNMTKSGKEKMPLQLCNTKEIVGEHDLLTLYGSVASNSKIQSSIRKERKGEDLNLTKSGKDQKKMIGRKRKSKDSYRKMNSGKYFGETKRTNDTRKRKPTKVFSKNKKSKNKCFRNAAKKSWYDLRSKHHSWVSKKKKSFSQTSRYDFRSRKDFAMGNITTKHARIPKIVFYPKLYEVTVDNIDAALVPEHYKLQTDRVRGQFAEDQRNMRVEPSENNIPLGKKKNMGTKMQCEPTNKHKVGKSETIVDRLKETFIERLKHLESVKQGIHNNLQNEEKVVQKSAIFGLQKKRFNIYHSQITNSIKDEIRDEDEHVIPIFIPRPRPMLKKRTSVKDGKDNFIQTTENSSMKINTNSCDRLGKRQTDSQFNTAFHKMKETDLMKVKLEPIDNLLDFVDGLKQIKMEPGSGQRRSIDVETGSVQKEITATETRSVQKGSNDTATGSVQRGSNDAATGSVQRGSNDTATGGVKRGSNDAATGSVQRGSNDAETGGVQRGNNDAQKKSERSDIETGNATKGDNAKDIGIERDNNGGILCNDNIVQYEMACNV